MTSKLRELLSEYERRQRTLEETVTQNIKDAIEITELVTEMTRLPDLGVLVEKLKSKVDEAHKCLEAYKSIFDKKKDIVKEEEEMLIGGD